MKRIYFKPELEMIRNICNDAILESTIIDQFAPENGENSLY